ncbi:MAG: HlyD family efflux transporter periplasmic adaptor subunit [Xenococcaceae cyanobacterium]
MQFNSELPKPNASGEPEQHLTNNKINLPSHPVAQSDSIYGGSNTTSLPVPTNGANSSSEIVYQPPKNNESALANWSPGVSSFLEEPPASLPIRFIIGGAIFSLAFIMWAYLGQIEEIGKAQGKLVPKGMTYKVQPLELGKVVRVNAKEGQEVRAGQILAELDPELAQKEVDRLDQSLKAYQIQLSQKQALLERVKLETNTNTAMISAEAMAQTSSIALAQEKATTTRRLLEQQRGEIAGYQKRQQSVNSLPEAAKAALEQMEQQVKAARDRVNRLAPLVKQGAIAQENLYQAEKELRDAQQRVVQAQLQDINNANEQIFNANRSLQDIETRITQGRGDYASAIEEIKRLQAELAQKQAQGEKIQLEAQQKIQQLEVEIAQLNGQAIDTKNQLISARSKLKFNYLKAPVDGVISAFNIQNTGEVVQAGQTVAEIAPEGAPLVLSAVVPNREAGLIKENMPVKIKLDAFPYQDYGVVSGKVTNISADSKDDKKLGEVYRVEVQLDRNYVFNERNKIEFKAGQTGNAEIIIRHRRVADVLLEPIKQMQKDGLNL